jgi:uncharacterized protein YgiM (DUF1202 family)
MEYDDGSAFGICLAVSVDSMTRHDEGFTLFGPLARALCVVLLLLAGCARMRPKPLRQVVYVIAKQTYLRDRVAAVSNRTGTVENGDKLQVLERGRRFIRVETEKGEVGWIDEKAVAPQEVADSFEALKRDHGADGTVASAVVRDEVYLHVKPGRDTDRLYRLAEGEKLKLLKRATLEKALPPGARAPALVAAPVAKGAGAVGVKGAAAVPEGPPAPAMEDWWLVRDSQGRTGWLLSRMMDVDAPEALTRYAEGQRMVGAYLLATVEDPDAPQDLKQIPEYVTVLSPYKAGLPYDFDQVRVFTWNVKKHRYETGFREKNIEGYLPIQIKMETDPYAKGAAANVQAPMFRYKALPADAPAVAADPKTGEIKAPRTVTKTYRLEGNLVRRVIAPGATTEDLAHPVPVEEKKKKKGRGRR